LIGVVLNLDATGKTFTLHTANGNFSIQAETNTELSSKAALQ
jgi:hypothetical protein